MNIGGDTLSIAAMQFGLRLLSQVVTTSPGENVIVSPSGVFQALSLYAFVGGDSARIEMRKALQIENPSDDALYLMYSRLSQRLTIHSPTAELLSATGLWTGSEIVPDPSFAALADRWGIAVFAGENVTAEKMRRWAKEYTHGLLSVEMNPPGPTGSTLMNALYFRGAWESPFAAEETKDRLFHRTGGMPKLIPLMRQPDTWAVHFYRDKLFEAARIPYESANDHKLSLHIIMPRRNVRSAPAGKDQITPLIEQFTMADWERCQSGYAAGVVDLILPRFTFRQTHDLKPMLMRMDMRKAFDAIRGSAAARTEPFVPPIDRIDQQAYIAMDEAGTEASVRARKAIIGEASGLPEWERPWIQKFYVNRPFLFFLMDDAGSLPLFAGVIHDPTPPAI